MKTVKKIKKPKKLKVPKLKKDLWKIWSSIVRHKNYCDLCGIKNGELTKNNKKCVLNAHHLISKDASYNLAWDVENGISLCQNCHRFSKIGPHKNSLIFANWFNNKYPEKYQYLLDKWMVPFDLSIENLQKIQEILQKTLENLEKVTK